MPTTFGLTLEDFLAGFGSFTAGKITFSRRLNRSLNCGFNKIIQLIVWERCVSHSLFQLNILMHCTVGYHKLVGFLLSFQGAPETFRARKAIFSSSASKNGEVYEPETSVHINSMLSKIAL